MQRPEWAPATIDLERPSVARMYDYFPGGSHDFAVDREVARQVIAAVPGVPLRAPVNRAFLVEPGLVRTARWRPDPMAAAHGAERSVMLAGVGRLGG